jgi:UDP-N-acetylenolpyruvoylglucosamine reductase
MQYTCTVNAARVRGISGSTTQAIREVLEHMDQERVNSGKQRIMRRGYALRRAGVFSLPSSALVAYCQARGLGRDACEAVRRHVRLLEVIASSGAWGYITLGNNAGRFARDRRRA